MRNIPFMIATGFIACFLLAAPAHAEEVSRAQIKGLDEQVQEIKSDVIAIAAELNQLEEKLLFPSQTQVAVFVSLAKGEEFRVDSLEVRLDGETVATHLYTFKELEALQNGGVQRIYTGNLRTGSHNMHVLLKGKAVGGSHFERSGTFGIQKDVGPAFVEIVLAKQSIGFQDR